LRWVLICVCLFFCLPRPFPDPGTLLSCVDLDLPCDFPLYFVDRDANIELLALRTQNKARKINIHFCVIDVSVAMMSGRFSNFYAYLKRIPLPNFSGSSPEFKDTKARENSPT